MKQGYFETAIGKLYARYDLNPQVVVFLSGAGTFPTYENYQGVIQHLPENMGFLAVDLPNSGRSELSNQVGGKVRRCCWGLARNTKIFKHLMLFCCCS